MKGKRKMTPAQLANLKQYKDKSVKEMEVIGDRVNLGSTKELVEKVLKSFEDDYDLSGMTVNDKLALLELARIFVSLEEIKKADDAALGAKILDIGLIDKLSKVASTKRTDASKIQQDLNITRKARQDAGGQSVPDFLGELKKRAKHFIGSQLSEIYCPQCSMLLVKIWFLYPELENTVIVNCGRCKRHFEVTSKHLAENKGKNIEKGPPR